MASKNSILTPEEKIRNLQRTLYRQAKEKPKWKAWSLYGDLCRRDLLKVALKQVVENKGTAGVDGMKVEVLKDKQKEEELLKELLNLLKEKSYKPDPVRRVYIPKASGGRRALGIPTVRDRIVQTALKMLLEPILEADFHPNSYGYRPKKHAYQALDTIREALMRGKLEVVDADLSNYFDTIPHRQLLKKIKKRVSDGSILKLVKAFLRAPIVEEDKHTGKKRHITSKCGTPQGGVISPLLANLYLNDLDYAVNERCELKPKMVRYADDLVIICKQGEGPELKERLKDFLKAKGLKLNTKKTRIIKTRKEGFKFVGFQINWRRGWKSRKYYPHTEPSNQSQQKLRYEIRKILNHWTTTRDTREVLNEINQKIRGWSNYFHYCHSGKVFGEMQTWIDARLHKWLWKKHGRQKGKWRRNIEEYGLYRLPLWIRY